MAPLDQCVYFCKPADGTIKVIHALTLTAILCVLVFSNSDHNYI